MSERPSSIRHCIPSSPEVRWVFASQPLEDIPTMRFSAEDVNADFVGVLGCYWLSQGGDFGVVNVDFAGVLGVDFGVVNAEIAGFWSGVVWDDAGLEFARAPDHIIHGVPSYPRCPRYQTKYLQDDEGAKPVPRLLGLGVEFFNVGTAPKNPYATGDTGEKDQQLAFEVE
ncbi:hypothetical protein PG988_006586 [Apiospora saccharicola]